MAEQMHRPQVGLCTHYDDHRWALVLTSNFCSVEILSAYEPGLFIHLLSPTPLLMTVAHDDILAPADIAFDVYEKARHPKQLQV